MKRTLFLLVLIVSCVSAAAQREKPDERFDRAYDAWCNGDYIRALEGFEAVMKSPDADRYFERIALITGELYQVTEVAPDGRSLRFSPSGRYAAFEVGSRTAPLTRLVDVENRSQKVADIQGLNLVFSPAQETVAYLRIKETPELTTVRKEVERLTAQAAPDRQALMEQQRQLTLLEAKNGEVALRDIRSGNERILEDDGLLKGTLAFSADGREVYFVGAKESDTDSNDIYAVSESGKPRAITSGRGFKTGMIVVPGNKYLVYIVPLQSPFPRTSGREQGGRSPFGQGSNEFAVLSLAEGRATSMKGSAPSISANGTGLVYLIHSGNESAIQLMKFGGSPDPVTVKKATERIGTAALSPDGSLVTYDMAHMRNQEIFCVKSDGTGEIRLSREIQNDRLPRFIDASQVLAIKGESRHSRAYLYDIKTLTNTKLFHNNTVRTIAPEYEWAVNPAGTLVLIQAERDGDTLSGRRGVYLLDLTLRIDKDALKARIRANLASEEDLRARGEATFRSIADKVRSAAEQISIRKLYENEEALFNFDSKHISQPGNKPAGEYLFAAYKSFGYEPEYQWFNSGNIRTANVLATLRGTENPDLIYVLSSHFDSNQRGPGADDNSSATAVLLETARVLAKTPMPATIIFASFTGEEAGLLGSREFVRQAVEKKLRIAADLNNDMIGWANDYRLDNTIRYTNAGIRDIQHAAAFLFSKMITYDAHYVKSTDAAAFYDTYGDVIGGFGSYPVLGSPYYHQPTDLLENVNQQLLLEAAKANTAAIMMLASSPAPVKDLKVVSARSGAVELSWSASAEKGISSYIVTYGPESAAAARTTTVKEPRVRLTGLNLKAGGKLNVAVKGVNTRGLSSWDWTRATVPIGDQK